MEKPNDNFYKTSWDTSETGMLELFKWLIPDEDGELKFYHDDPYAFLKAELVVKVLKKDPDDFFSIPNGKAVKVERKG